MICGRDAAQEVLVGRLVMRRECIESCELGAFLVRRRLELLKELLR